MHIITVRFISKWPPNIASLLVARCGGSKQFSHVMNMIDGMAYEATFNHGCRIVPVKQAMEGASYYQDMYVPVQNIETAINFGKMQRGKKYDVAGALGIPFLMSEDWGDWSKWWCSEFAFMQIGIGGNFLFDKDAQKRITPQHLHMCNYKKSELKKYIPD